MSAVAEEPQLIGATNGVQVTDTQATAGDTVYEQLDQPAAAQAGQLELGNATTQLVPPPVPAGAVKQQSAPQKEVSEGEHDSNASGDQVPPGQTQERTKDTFESDDTLLPNQTAAGLEANGGVASNMMAGHLQQLAEAQQQASMLQAAQMQAAAMQFGHLGLPTGVPQGPQVPPQSSSAQATNTANTAKKFGPGERPKLPRPEGTVPCPRCQSEDTKFCYYNNYNTNQPRYFCKACQRYWTAGGTLRNVPPGSGKRKNKSSKARESQNDTQSQQTARTQATTVQPPAIPLSFSGLPGGYALQTGAMFMDPTSMFAAAGLAKPAEINSALGAFVPTPGLSQFNPMAAAAAFNPQMAEQLLQMQKATHTTSAATMPLLPSAALSVDANSQPPIPTSTNNADGAASALLPMGGNNAGATSRNTNGFGLQSATGAAEPASDLLALSGEDGSLGGRRVRLKTDPSLAGNTLPPTSSQQGSDSSPYGNNGAGALSGGPSGGTKDESAAPVAQMVQGDDANKGQQSAQQVLDWNLYTAMANQQVAAQAAQLQAAAAYGQTANYMNGFTWPYSGLYPAAAQQWAAYARYAQATQAGNTWLDPSKPLDQQQKDAQTAVPPPLPNIASPQAASPARSKGGAQSQQWGAWHPAAATGLSPWAGWGAPAAAGAAAQPILQAMGGMSTAPAGLESLLKPGDGDAAAS